MAPHSSLTSSPPVPSESTQWIAPTTGPHILVAEGEPHEQWLWVMAAERARASVRLEFVGLTVEVVDRLRHLDDAGRLPAAVMLGSDGASLSGVDALAFLGGCRSSRPVEDAERKWPRQTRSFDDRVELLRSLNCHVDCPEPGLAPSDNRPDERPDHDGPDHERPERS